MNYWEEKPDFWKNKTDGDAIYEAQGRELGAVINDLAKRLGAQSVLDVGGYTGRMRQYLAPGLHYFNYDIVNGIDITKPWDKKGEPRMKYDIVFTSLTLICFSPEDVEKIMWEIRGHATKAIVLFEEDWFGHPSFVNGRKISEEYGGKWQHNWLPLLKAHDGNVKKRRSEVNAAWSILTQIL